VCAINANEFNMYNITTSKCPAEKKNNIAHGTILFLASGKQ